MLTQHIELGLHPQAIRKGYCLTKSQTFELLYKAHIVRSYDTFLHWMRGTRNPREDILRRTWDLYQELLENGEQPLVPDVIPQYQVQLEW